MHYNETWSIDKEFIYNFNSRATRTSYQTDLKQFFSFLANYYPKIKSYRDIERIHVVDYRNQLQETGGRDGGPSAPKSVSRKLAALSSYFDFLTEKSRMDFNPASSVKRPRREVLRPTHALTREQVEELLSAIDNNKKSGPLHKALLIMFFTTGLRKSEILNLKFSDYKKLGDHMIVEYKGKGGKIGQKLLHPLCIESLEDYLDWMEHNDRKHQVQDWLFQPTKNPSDPTNLNKPLNPKTINEILNSYAKKIGLGFPIKPHSARATFITELLKIGTDIYTVAREVNHSSVKTTQEYDKRRRDITDSPVYNLKISA